MRILVVALMAIFGWVTLAGASETERERVIFPIDSNIRTIQGRIKGNEAVEYVVKVRAGQRLVASLRTDNRAATIDVFAPNGKAIFVGANDGPRFNGKIGSGGDHTVRIALDKAAASKRQAADYQLDFRVEGGQPEEQEKRPTEEFGGRGAGGNAKVRVVGLKGNDRLDILMQPDPSSRVIASVPAGTRLSRGDCENRGKVKWCKVSVIGAGGTEGWSNAAFLKE